MTLRLKNISLPLAPFSLELNVEIRSRVTAIFGSSGAGKTSLLDLIAGLRRPHTAFIELAGRVLTDTASGIFLPPQQRRIGYVPQDLALFPHLDVNQNLQFGRKSDPGVDGLFSLAHVVEVLEIQPLIARSIRDLSGGEKQRVALARALLSSPQMLLLDEPLASLDAKLKSRIIPYFLRVRDEFQLPILYVTHEAEEVRALCDAVVFLESGRCVRQGSAAEIFEPRGHGQ